MLVAGAQLRLRLLARARGVGARGPGLPRGHQHAARGHLQAQRAAERPGAGRDRRRPPTRACATRAPWRRRVDVAALTRLLARRAAPRSRFRRSRAAACWKGGTSSTSFSRTKTRSPRTSAAHSWRPRGPYGGSSDGASWRRNRSGSGGGGPARPGRVCAHPRAGGPRRRRRDRSGRRPAAAVDAGGLPGRGRGPAGRGRRPALGGHRCARRTACCGCARAWACSRTCGRPATSACPLRCARDSRAERTCWSSATLPAASTSASRGASSWRRRSTPGGRPRSRPAGWPAWRSRRRARAGGA